MEVSRLLRIRGHYLMQVGYIEGMILFTAYLSGAFWRLYDLLHTEEEYKPDLMMEYILYPHPKPDKRTCDA